jgi:hypothetical protein
MSIVACVKVYDGIVLGAESMTQLWSQPIPGQTQFVKAYGNARKLFQIADLPFGVLTYGAGNIGQRSIESFIDEFNEKLITEHKGQISHLKGEQIVTEFFDHIRAPYDQTFGQIPPAQKPILGFYLAGFSPGSHLGSEWEFVLPQSDKPAKPRSGEAEFGASWRGVSVPFTRLYSGFDPRIVGMLAAQNIPPDVIEKIQNIAKTLQSPIAFDGMPLQDAIGFCRFILDTTIGQCAYEFGVPSCGGPLQIAVITRREKFSWILKPSYSV